MTDRRHNATQLVLELAAGQRVHDRLMAVVETREAIRPLERRRLHRLARLVALSPICRRGRF